MNHRIEINSKNAEDRFYFRLFSSVTDCGSFDCGISEYNEYLFQDALRSLNDHIALTWLLTERSTEKTIAYMSLIIEHDNGVLVFYEKNGFIPNAELYNKNRKVIFRF